MLTKVAPYFLVDQLLLYVFALQEYDMYGARERVLQNLVRQLKMTERCFLLCY